MKTPIKISVVSEFAPDAEACGPITIAPGKLDEAMAKLRPRLVLDHPSMPARGKGLELEFASLEDFEIPKLKEKAAEATGTAEHITAMIHDPKFQALESAWRGLEYMTREMNETTVVEILNAPFDDVRQRYYDFVFKPEYDGLTSVPLSMTLFDYDFNHKASTLDVLKDLAKMGEALQAPVVGQTGASLFAVKHLLHLPAIDDPFAKLKAGEWASFNGFRDSDTSYWAGLLINQFLLREPYATEEYKEPVSPRKPEQYLWGRAIWVLGANSVRSVVQKGHLATISGLGTGGENAKLPIRELPITRSEKVNTPLEASFPIDIVEAMPYFGVSPLAQLPGDLGGQNQPDMIYLHLAANMHRMPDQSGERTGLLTVHTTLSYSLMLGRVSNLCLRHKPELTGMDQEDAAAKLKSLLAEELNSSGEELGVTADGAVLHVTYKPSYVIHTRTFEISFDLPLN